MDEIEIGSIIQVTNKEHDWFPCLVVVDKVKSFGIRGYIDIPMMGTSYIRLNKSDYEKVGKAVYVSE